MGLTWIDVADTAIKIGLGSLITAVSGYLAIKKTHNNETIKERKHRFYKTQEDKKAIYVEFLSQSQVLVQAHIITSCTCDTKEYNEYLRTYNEITIIADDEIRLAAFALFSSVNEFIIINKNGLDGCLRKSLRKSIDHNVGMLQKLAQMDVCKVFNET